MITRLEDGTVLLKMGEGTLYSSVVRNDEKVYGLCFPNSPEKLEDGVVFAINSSKGIAGYIRPLVNMFEEYAKLSEESNEKKEQFNREIQAFKEFVDSMWHDGEF